jgi:ATP-dependent Zn protease
MERVKFMNSKARIALVCSVLMCVAGVLWVATTSRRSLTTLTYSQFLKKVGTGQIASVVVMGSNSGAIEAICRLNDGNSARTVLPSDYRDAMLAMQDKLVNVEIRGSAGTLRPSISATPFLLLLDVWIFLMICKSPNGRFTRHPMDR